MTASYFWGNIAALALGTFAIRYSIIAISARLQITERVKQIFTFIPAAILPAFIFPSTFFHEGHVGWLLNRERFVIVLLACALCYFVRSTLIVIGFGLAVLSLVTR